MNLHEKDFQCLICSHVSKWTKNSESAAYFTLGTGFYMRKWLRFITIYLKHLIVKSNKSTFSKILKINAFLFNMILLKFLAV
jgi:hypothetical protein